MKKQCGASCCDCVTCMFFPASLPACSSCSSCIYLATLPCIHTHTHTPLLLLLERDSPAMPRVQAGLSAKPRARRSREPSSTVSSTGSRWWCSAARAGHGCRREPCRSCRWRRCVHHPDDGRSQQLAVPGPAIAFLCCCVADRCDFLSWRYPRQIVMRAIFLCPCHCSQQ